MTQAVLPGNDFVFILRRVQQRQGRSVATEAEWYRVPAQAGQVKIAPELERPAPARWLLLSGG